jgi:hypothetical protein
VAVGGTGPSPSPVHEVRSHSLIVDGRNKEPLCVRVLFYLIYII